MPVRMEKDQPNDPRKNRPEDPPLPPTQRKRKIPIVALLLGILAVFKKPKLLFPVLILLGLYYIYINYIDVDPSTSQVSAYEYETSNEEFTFGAELSVEEYDKAMVFEPLAVGSTTLPPRVLLEDYAPRPLHQGSQGSCSGWASAYGARTVSYAMASGKNPNQTAFSPSFLYNQIALPRCEGAYLRDAMEAMKNIGSLPFREFGYTDQTCQIAPDYGDREAAAQYRIKGYTRLSEGARNYGPNINAVKQHLAQGAPVVIGMMVGQSFQYAMMGQKVWNPTQAEYNGRGVSGHAMCLIGYDDNMNGGAFRVMNSWGTQWGDDGFAWIRYRDFQQFTKEAYGLFPEGKADRYDKDRFEVKFALVNNESQDIIPLRQVDEIVFRTSSPVQKGDKFKLAITNSVECYTYIFGMETDGSSYVLFPYTDKHSPYCGITGTRLFPKDYSMVPDQIGNRDYIAIIVSKAPLDYEAVNRRINASRGSNYMMRMVQSIIDDFVPECEFEANGSVYFNCRTSGKNALGMIVEIDKR